MGKPEAIAAVAAAIVLVLGAIFKFVLDWYKTKNEREAALERLEVLRDIAVTNRAIRDGQIAQNGKLSLIMKINDDRHEEMIRALMAPCPAKFHVPINQETKQ